MKVYEKIAAVTLEMSKVGISKARKNSQGSGYMFRGIDDVYSALSPLLASHGLCILPRVMSRTVSEQTSKAGGLLFYTALMVEFDFVAAEDGSKHTVCTVGEAMDSGDKSSNKAMSAAYKYACFQAFCIPTEGDNDADSKTHEVVDKVLNGQLAAMAVADSDALARIFTAAVAKYQGNETAVLRLVDAKARRTTALQNGPKPALEESLRDSLVAQGVPYSQQDPPLELPGSDAAAELYEKAAVLAEMRKIAVQDVVKHHSEFNGKCIESEDHARKYLVRKPDGKWVSMTMRKIEDEIRERMKPTAEETPDWAA